MTALLGATVDWLKTALSLTESNVGASYDGQPPAFDGEEYFQCHPGTVRNKADLSLDETYDLAVTLTRRTGYAPQDRIGSDTMLDVTVGLYKRADAVKTALHMGYGVLDLAGGTTGVQTWTGGNAYSIAGTAEGFYHPLIFADYSVPIVKGPEWFWAAAGEGDAPTGIAIEIRFRDAQRLQTIESMA